MMSLTQAVTQAFAPVKQVGHIKHEVSDLIYGVMCRKIVPIKMPRAAHEEIISQLTAASPRDIDRAILTNPKCIKESSRSIPELVEAIRVSIIVMGVTGIVKLPQSKVREEVEIMVNALDDAICNVSARSFEHLRSYKCSEGSKVLIEFNRKAQS